MGDWEMPGVEELGNDRSHAILAQIFYEKSGRNEKSEMRRIGCTV
jgi:hypothetical protein